MSLPYYYLPETDFANFLKAISVFEYNLTCDDSSCKFEQPCSNVTIDKWYLSFALFDDSIGFTYGLPSDFNFLVNGDLMGDSASTCYLPVFKNSQSNQRIWYIGNIVMNYFYMVFDMTPLDE